jgi:hypothetical protein
MHTLRKADIINTGNTVASYEVLPVGTYITSVDSTCFLTSYHSLLSNPLRIGSNRRGKEVRPAYNTYIMPCLSFRVLFRYEALCERQPGRKRG